MTARFHGPLSDDLRNFLLFKRNLGYRYGFHYEVRDQD
jgi:hypothetical protein